MQTRHSIQKTIGALKCLTVEGSARGPCVVLFHGYGADASDLLPLADLMGLSNDVTWVFPDAPMEIISAPGIYGRAWYQIDAAKLERSLRSGEPVDMSKTTPQGLEGARKLATSLFDELLKRHSGVIVGGFSQGATLAIELTMTAAQPPAGLVIMSGTLICENRWQDMAPKRAGMPFFQSHGKNDALLGYEYAEKLYSMLDNAGWNGDFFSFGGGHEIPPKVIEKIGQFIRGTLRIR